MKIYELEESAQENINMEAPQGHQKPEGSAFGSNSKPSFGGGIGRVTADIPTRLNKRGGGSKVFGDVALT